MRGFLNCKKKMSLERICQLLRFLTIFLLLSSADRFRAVALIAFYECNDDVGIQIADALHAIEGVH